VLPSPSMPACCLESSSDPSGRNASWALATAIWSGRTMTPMLPRIDRTWTSPLRPPRAPGEALIRVATLPLKATRDGSPRAGRDTQSMTFFRTAVMELLYSGEARSKPSWSMKSCLSFFPFSGIPCSASRSWSNSGNGKSLRSIRVTSAPASRAALAAMDTSFLLKDSLRRLPAKARMRGVIVLAPSRSLIDRVTSGWTPILPTNSIWTPDHGFEVLHVPLVAVHLAFHLPAFEARGDALEHVRGKKRPFTIRAEVFVRMAFLDSLEQNRPEEDAVARDGDEKHWTNLHKLPGH